MTNLDNDFRFQKMYASGGQEIIILQLSHGLIVLTV